MKHIILYKVSQLAIIAIYSENNITQMGNIVNLTPLQNRLVIKSPKCSFLKIGDSCCNPAESSILESKWSLLLAQVSFEKVAGVCFIFILQTIKIKNGSFRALDLLNICAILSQHIIHVIASGENVALAET